MLNRSHLAVSTLGLALLLFVLATWLPQTASAADRHLDRDEIRAALRVSPQEDDGFIDYVITKVERGELSRAIVTKAFLWAKKKSDKRFQYFKFAVLKLAKRR
jgi:hypothetical protein